MKNYQYGENYHIIFITFVIYDLLINVIKFTYLCLVIFCHFDTFLDGWVGGRVGSIKIKDHLSPVEIEIGAELGKNKSSRMKIHQ